MPGRKMVVMLTAGFPLNRETAVGTDRYHRCLQQIQRLGLPGGRARSGGSHARDESREPGRGDRASTSAGGAYSRRAVGRSDSLASFQNSFQARGGGGTRRWRRRSPAVERRGGSRRAEARGGGARAGGGASTGSTGLGRRTPMARTGGRSPRESRQQYLPAAAAAASPDESDHEQPKSHRSIRAPSCRL